MSERQARVRRVYSRERDQKSSMMGFAMVGESDCLRTETKTNVMGREKNQLYKFIGLHWSGRSKESPEYVSTHSRQS